MLSLQLTSALVSWLGLVFIGFLPCTTWAFLQSSNSLQLLKRDTCSDTDISNACAAGIDNCLAFWCSTTSCLDVIGEVLYVCCGPLQVDNVEAMRCISDSVAVAESGDSTQTSSSDSAQVTDDPGSAACDSWSGIVSSCSAATTNFDALDSTSQASCYCATSGVYDDYFGSCLNYISTAVPDTLSSLVSENGGPLDPSPCTAFNDAATITGDSTKTTGTITKSSLTTGDVQSTTKSQPGSQGDSSGTAEKTNAASTTTGMSL
jgi:hypothetical protein